MKHFTKYLISDTEQFIPENFSLINDEVLFVNEHVKHLPAFYKEEMIVSFLKDHSLQNHWIKTNPELTSLVTSGSLFTGSIESLFESSKKNPSFRLGLEKYLLKRFA